MPAVFFYRSIGQTAASKFKTTKVVNHGLRGGGTIARQQPENVLAEAFQSIRFLWSHRKGQEIPAAVMDTFDNLGYVTKDGRRPLLVAKKKTPYGWHLAFSLPPGISFAKVRRQREYFADAVKGWVNLSWDGILHMDVYTGRLPKSLPFQWDPAPFGKMTLPIPVGVSQQGLEVLDLAESPHLLVAGVPGFGKSNFLHVLIHSLLPRSLVCIIDLKRLEFAYLRDHAAVTRNEDEALAMLRMLNREMERRIDTLEAAGVVKIQDFAGEMPCIVLVVDEVAELKDEEALELIDRLVRLARAVGISVVAATQRPSIKVISGDTRAMFAARLCFQVADELNSRMVLGESCPLAANLPGIKGRAIFKFGLVEKEVQTMFLPLQRARELIRQLPARGWQYQCEVKRLPPR
ncbi:MAG: FtsK/SpoIIIE domain-containing protein [Firmicutes bacterium]|nr:FtsK/SpoIIIE domain-containing protein [Bacillota bacterium]